MNELKKIVLKKQPSCILVNETGGVLELGKDLDFRIRGYDAFPNDRSIDKKGGEENHK